MRHSAWLNAVPEAAKNRKAQTRRLSRLEQRRRIWLAEGEGRKKEDYAPDMPPLEGATHLVEILFEIGPVMAAGMGEAPVSEQELRAWQANSGIKLQPWEARFVRRVSRDYCAESHRAQEMDCAPPWTPPDGGPGMSDTQMARRIYGKD